MKIIDGILTCVKDSDIVDGTFIFPEGVTKIGYEAFFNLKSLITLTIPDSVTEIDGSAFYGCSSLTTLIIPDGVTKIGEHALYDCSSLTTLVLPKNITKLEDFLLFNCSKLTTLAIPDGVTEIGHYALSNCSSLTTLIIPNSVTKIGEYALWSCRSLIKLKISNNVTEIHKSAFGKCESLTKLSIPGSVTKIRKDVFYGCSKLTTLVLPNNPDTINEVTNCSSDIRNLKEIETPYGIYTIEDEFDRFRVNLIYLYLYANSILKEKFNSFDEFIGIPYIKYLFRTEYIKNEKAILKFENLFYKLRKEFDVPPNLFNSLALDQTEKFNYSVWNKIKNTFDYENNYDMAKAFADMINVFGLFENDKNRNNRIQYFIDLFEKRKIVLSEEDFNNLNNNNKYDLFEIKKKTYYFLKENIEVPEEFEVYLKDKLTEKQMKKIKKVTGTFGKRLNDFVKDNYISTIVNEYQLSKEYYDNKVIRDEFFKKDILGTINKYSLHRMFDVNIKGFNDDFYKFFQDNLEEILNDEKLQSKISEISNKFDKIKNYYLVYSGITDITLKHVTDYLNRTDFEYEPGNYELNLDIKKAGVTNQASFDYYQQIHNKNDIRKLYSLVRRSNVYEINGYTIKAELLRRDDSFGMLVGEVNYTNCCQVFNGIGHNCLAHSVNSDDGGVFVTRLLKDGEWILLTESWNWQNNNVYCHDNIEGTSYLKQSDKNLKKAVSEVYRLDGEHIIKKSKNEVEKYIKSRMKMIDKLSIVDKEKELDILKNLEQREVIKVVTIGSGYDDLGLENYFSSKIQVNKDMFVNGETYKLSNFQPVNYDSSQEYFNSEKEAYSDAKEIQYIIAGSIENLAVSKLEPLVPIYRDERRIVSETGEELRDYTVNKVRKIEKESFPDELLNHQQSRMNDYKDKNIILGEDWYLIYEEIDFDEVYIYDLAKVKPSLEDEFTIQNQEMMREIYKLVDKYNIVSCDLKEDTSYLLYLINKKLGYFTQIGDDIAYPYGNKSNKTKITDEVQEDMLKNAKNIKEQGNPEFIMHKITFTKGPKFSYKSEEEKEINNKF